MNKMKIHSKKNPGIYYQFDKVEGKFYRQGGFELMDRETLMKVFFLERLIDGTYPFRYNRNPYWQMSIEGDYNRELRKHI